MALDALKSEKSPDLAFPDLLLADRSMLRNALGCFCALVFVKKVKLAGAGSVRGFGEEDKRQRLLQ